MSIWLHLEKESDSWEDSKHLLRLKENRHIAQWLCMCGVGVGLFLIKQHTFYYHASYTESIWVCYERKFYSNIDISTPRSPLRKFCWDEMIKQMKKTVLVHEKCILGRNWKNMSLFKRKEKKIQGTITSIHFHKNNSINLNQKF